MHSPEITTGPHEVAFMGEERPVPENVTEGLIPDESPLECR